MCVFSAFVVSADRTCSEQCAASAAEVHMKYNGPLHAGFHKLMFQEHAGDRFVSFPTAVHHFLHSAARNHDKYHCELKAHDKQVQEDNGAHQLVGPKQTFFWSQDGRNAAKIVLESQRLKQHTESVKKKSDAAQRKKEERKRGKSEKSDLKRKDKEEKRQRKQQKKENQEVSGEEESSEEEDAPSGGQPLCRTCSNRRQGHLTRGARPKVPFV